MIADAQDACVSLLDGPGGLIGQLTARVIERALGAGNGLITWGYVKGDPGGKRVGEFPERLLREDAHHDVGTGAGSQCPGTGNLHSSRRSW